MAITIPILTDFNDKGLNKAKKSFGQLETKGQKAQFALRKAAIPAAIALAAVGKAIIGGTKAAIEDQKSSQQLQRTLGKTTKATKSQLDAVEDYITATERATVVSDLELRPALGQLATATGSLEEGQKGLALALDIAAGTGKPLAQVSGALSKAYAGNLKGLNALDPRMKTLIKNGATADEAMAILSKTFEGDAAAAANTVEGRMKGVSIAMGEAQESIGHALLPVLEKIIPVFVKFSQFLQRNPKILIAVVAGVGALAGGILVLNLAMTLLAANPIALAITGIVIGVVALTVGITLLYRRSETFRKIVQAAFKAVEVVVRSLVRFFRGPVIAAFNTVQGVVKAIAGLLRGDFSAAWAGLTQAIGGVLDGIKTTLLAFPALMVDVALGIGRAIANGIRDGVVGLAGLVWENIRNLPGDLASRVGGWATGLGNIGSGIITTIAKSVTGLAAKAWENIKGMAQKLVGLVAGWGEKLGEIGTGIITKIVGGVTGLATGIWGKIKDTAKDLAGSISGLKAGMEGIGKTLIGYIGAGFGAAGNVVIGALKRIVNGAIRIVQRAIDGINRIRGAVNKINPFADIPRIPDLPRLARGGIVTKPTVALIGEAGPEAVIPLSRPNRFTRNGQGPSITINIEAGLVSTPDQIGQQIIEAIQLAQRRSGPVFAAA
jgi:hypothetical protein